MSLGFYKQGQETLVWLRDAGQTHLWSLGRLWNSDRHCGCQLNTVVGLLWHRGRPEKGGKVRLFLLTELSEATLNIRSFRPLSEEAKISWWLSAEIVRWYNCGCHSCMYIWSLRQKLLEKGVVLRLRECVCGLLPFPFLLLLRGS